MNAISEINEATAQEYFSRLDALVKPGTELYVIGGSAIALLGAKIRTTAGVDVALLCSKLDIAAYQAGSCDYGMRGFIDNVRRRLNRPALAVTEVPSGMVKDVVLPKYRVPEF